MKRYKINGESERENEEKIFFVYFFVWPKSQIIPKQWWLPTTNHKRDENRIKTKRSTKMLNLFLDAALLTYFWKVRDFIISSG